MAILRSDVGKLHLHEHVHLQEGNGTVGVTVGLLQGYFTVLVADTGKLGLDGCYLFNKLELRRKVAGQNSDLRLQCTYVRLQEYTAW